MILAPLIAVMLAPAACPPAAMVQGALAPEMEAALSRRGVRTSAPEGCEILRITVSTGPMGPRVSREGEPARDVPDMETAALLVETWVRADLIDPLLAARRAPPPPPPPPPAPMPAPKPGRALHVDAALELGVAVDRSLWQGARVGGCIEIAGLCLGVRLRAAFDGGWVGESDEAEVLRLSFGVLAAADYALGPLYGGLGVGAQAVRIESKTSEADDMRGAPLFEARVGARVPLFDDWDLELGVAGDLALWPRRGEGRDADEDFPGLPHWMVIGGAGLHWTGR